MTDYRPGDIVAVRRTVIQAHKNWLDHNRPNIDGTARIDNALIDEVAPWTSAELCAAYEETEARLQRHVDNCNRCHGDNRERVPTGEPALHPLLGVMVEPGDGPCPNCAEDRAALARVRAAKQ